MAPEALFDPNLIKEGNENGGMAVLCHRTVQECDIDIRRELYSNIILSGGSTLYKGLPERLQ
jgi:actin beta/gamma 1